MLPSDRILAFIHFDSPGYLVLLAILPLLVALSYRSLAGLGPGRRIVAIVVRCLVVTLMVLALAGAQRVRENHDLSVIFLVDRSNSIPQRLQSDAFSFLRAVGEDSEDRMRPDDRIGVIAFDGRSAIEQLPTGALAIERITGPIEPEQTDIAAALRMGLATFPPDTARRLVLISDGNENVGEASEEAKQLSAANIPIDVLPLRYHYDNEVIVERVSAPATAAIEETVNVQVVLRSQVPTSGRVLLYHNDRLIDLDPDSASAGYPVELSAGATRIAIPVPMIETGAHRWRAVFEPDNPGADGVAANNVGNSFTIVAGQGRILILSAGPPDSPEYESAAILARELREERLLVDLEIAGEKPIDQVRLLEYALVILNNVPANMLTREQQEGLVVYVSDLGGGLVMIGGDQSFGAGGWMGSPVEKIMPVSFDVKSKRQIPLGALVLVMHACEIPKGNYWGERVAVEAIKALSTLDLVGVLSYQWVNSQQGNWVIPLQPVGNKTARIQQIKKMQMGDMPSLQDVMSQGVEALIRRRDAAARHMIVISDFDPAGPDNALLDRMRKAGITCSTVAIGFGSHWIDTGKAQDIADKTKGKFYKTDDYSQLPKIFIKEAQVVHRNLLNEIPFSPALSNPLSPVLPEQTRIDRAADIPELHGYVVTTPKPNADIALVCKTNEGLDPILAYWQPAAGKTVAFTSGMFTRWSDQWAARPGFSSFWAHIARFASRQSEAAGLDVSTSVQGGRGRIRIDAVDKNADAVNSLTIRGKLIAPDFSARDLRLTQTGPGRYEGDFDVRDPGNYIISLAYGSGSGADARSGILQTGVSLAYSAEYRTVEPNLPLLDDLRKRTGGRALSAADAAGVFDRSALPAAESRRPIWEDLVRWMLVLFLIDVAVRRIAVRPKEVVRKARGYISDLAGPRRTAEESAAVLSTLKGTREKVRDGIDARPSDAGTPPDRAAKYEAPSAAKAQEDLTRALGGAGDADQPVVAPPGRKQPPTGEADYTSRLLQAKRRARDEMRKDEDQK